MCISVFSFLFLPPLCVSHVFTLYTFCAELLEQVHAIGKASKNVFSAAQNFSSFGADGDSSDHSPVISFKAHLIRLIGNLCHRNTKNQNKVRESVQRVKRCFQISMLILWKTLTQHDRQSVAGSNKHLSGTGKICSLLKEVQNTTIQNFFHPVLTLLSCWQDRRFSQRCQGSCGSYPAGVCTFRTCARVWRKCSVFEHCI